MEAQEVSTQSPWNWNWKVTPADGEAGFHQSQYPGSENGPSKIRVVLADDHLWLRAGIRRLLQSAPDIEIVGEAGDGVETLALVHDLCPDILVLDLDMPRLNGGQVAKRLDEEDSTVKVLILSAYDDPRLIQSLFEAGAAGYLIKDEAPGYLVRALRALARGERGFVSPSVADKLG